ncbi:ABC transporter permease [Lederbergia lenta]|uniref:ABC transporter permease n=1 Tax=Lederbergia lenta TaxID=1467 RepID=UPI00203FF6F8|nr:ABC transporter permease [Lederbergia lenta]MCM3112936.1 ABC transporter permease [Lederbergia lenta]
MSDFRTLKFLDLFKGIFRKFGIDYGVMRKILQVKLMMDQRRVPTIFNGAGKKKEGNHFLKSLGLYAFYGLILIPFILLGDNYIFQMSLVFGLVMFILMTSMISDFSTVLLDVRDKNILDTKPISKRTISAAKFFHVLIYMFLLTGAFVAIPLIVSLFSKGILFSFLFLVELILIGLFTVVLTALIYLFILRFFSGERLKDIINYVQILLSISILIGYQVLARSFELVDLQFTYSFHWWHLFIPAFWYGAPFDLLMNQHTSIYNIALTLLGLFVPIISILIYARLMPSFEQNLQKLLSDMNPRKRSTVRLDNLWAKLTCRREEERAFFRFASLMMKREREFKLKVYPTLGFAVIFPFIFLFNEVRTSSFAALSDSKMFLVIYFCNLMIPAIVHMLKFSGNYKGNWIYRATPIKEVSSIYSGTLKAFLVKMYAPIYFLLSILFIFIFSVEILPDLFAVLLAGLSQVLITYRLTNNETYPFSRSFEFAQDSNTANMIVLMIITVLFAGIHLLATFINYGLYVYIVILFVATIIGWRYTFPRLSKY